MNGVNSKIVDGVRESKFLSGAGPTLKDYLIEQRRKSLADSCALPPDRSTPSVTVGSTTDQFDGRVTLTVVITQGQTAKTIIGSGLSPQSATRDVIEKLLTDRTLREFL